MTVGSRTWVKQPVLKVNEATGNDENPGTVLLPIKTNREAARRVGPSVILTDFGASMNSTGNDAQAWADAVGFLKSMPYGGKIILPPGISNVVTAGPTAIDLSGFSATQQITIEGQGNVASRVRFNGQDFGFSAAVSNNITIQNLGIIGASGGAAQTISMQDVNFLTIRGVKMNGAQLRMPAAGPGACIFLASVNDLVVEDLELIGNGVDVDQCYGIVNWIIAGSKRHRYAGVHIENLGAHFGIGLYSMKDVDIGDVDINLNGKGNGSNDGYPILLYDISVDVFERNLVHDFAVRNCNGIGLYTPSCRYLAISNGVLQDTCKTQDPTSLPVAAIAVGGDYTTVDNVVIQTCASDGISVSADYCAVSNVSAQDVSRDVIALRLNSEGLVVDNVTGKNVGRIFFNYGGNTMRNATLTNLRGEELANDGVRLGISYGARVANCVMQDASNIGYIVDDGEDNTFENCTGQYANSYVFDIRSANSTLINCRAKASKKGGIQVTAPRCRIWDCDLWGLGAPGTLTGIVDLTALVLPAAVVGLTIIFTTTDYQSAVTVQTITFNANAASVSRLIDSINTDGVGIFASVVTPGNVLRLRTESGQGTISITGGTALAVLGLAVASNTGAPITEVEINALGDDCDMRDVRYSEFGLLTGTVVLVAGTATVFTEEIRDGDIIELDNFLLGGTQGDYSVAITGGISFVVTSTSAVDTSIVRWRIQRKVFAPSDIPTLTYWSRSDPDVTLTLRTGNLVDSENDKSGQNIPFSAVGAARPTYVGYTAAVNGVPTQAYDGVNTVKTGGATLAAVIPTATQFELFASFDVAAITTNHAPGANYFLNAPLIGDAGQFWGLFFRNPVPDKVGIYLFDVGEKVDEQTVTLGARHWIDAKLDTGNLAIAIDGGAFGAGVAAGPIGLLTGVLKKGQVPGSALFTGFESEICIFSNVLTTPQRTRMRLYMNGRIAP
jgi:hypothetical protein